MGVQDHEAPYFSNMRRRQSRKDSDLNGVVDVRYTGGARMLLLLVVGQGRWRFKVGLPSRLSHCPPPPRGAAQRAMACHSRGPVVAASIKPLVCITN